jgi:aminoglycoside/choline kinase family phosphotransferase
MWHDGRLHLIDFQDARMGPDTYDLVSLLRDSYVDLPPDLPETLVDHYLSRTARAGSATEFWRRFDAMALQRNLKALGTFGYQSAVRGTSVYVQYIPRTIAYARRTMVQYNRFRRLRSLLATYVPEFAE